MEVKKAKRRSKVARIATWALIALVVLCFIGLVVAVIMAEVSREDAARVSVCYIISFSCMGGLFVGIGGAVLFFKLGERFRAQEADARERADSEESFFIGEKMLFTFREGEGYIHAEDGSEEFRAVSVPYSELKFYTVNLRRSPKKKGEKSVLVAIPAYVLSKKKADKGAKPTLLMMEHKPRLMDCMQKRGVQLISADDDSPLPKPQKVMHIRSGRSKKPMSLFFGIVLIVGGILLAIFGGQMQMIGYLLLVFGIFSSTRGVIGLVRGGSGFTVYEDGIFWKEENRFESMYLRWSELIGYSRISHEKQYFVEFSCAYGEYYYPDTEGLYETLVSRFPEKKLQGAKRK